MIAALYVEKGGVYYGLDDVDPWDEERDARLYAGPWSVVAHPPCNRWSRLSSRLTRGQDGGCFAAALQAVERFGGVLEHPRHSQAWAAFGLAEPAGAHWVAVIGGGWVCEIDQAEWGLAAHKWTWLYFKGERPPDLRPTADASSAKPGPADLHSRKRHLTPEALAAQLVSALTPRPSSPRPSPVPP